MKHLHFDLKLYALRGQREEKRGFVMDFVTSYIPAVVPAGKCDPVTSAF